MRSTPQIKVSITVLKQMFEYLESIGVDQAAFLRSIGVDPGLVQSPDAYLPIETYLLIQDSAAEFTGDLYFGLHMGEFAQPGSWSILGYLLMNCANLGEAFEKSARYYRIIGTLIRGEPQLRFNKVRIIFSTPPHAPRMSRHCFEATFSSTVRMIRSLTGRDLNPLEVTFTYPEPDSAAEYQRIFQCPILFGQKHNTLSFHPRLSQIPIRMANPELLAYFEEYAREILAGMDADREHTNAVTRIILANLDDESLTIDRVAEEMAVSVRTLQNRLSEEGVVFTDLLLSIREKLAKKYLRENYTVEEITYLLGYSEPSVFRKAFKNWLGLTPRQYREQALSPAN